MKMGRLKKKIRKAITKVIPLWMVILLVINAVLATGFAQYYLLKRDLENQLIMLSKTTKNQEAFVQLLKQEVLPQKGYTLFVRWEDMGKKLVESGVIDKAKYDQLFFQDLGNKNMEKYLNNSSNDHMMINEKNAHFMVTMLWALGLVNKSKLLDFGQMKTNGQGDPMQYASTGGWVLGDKSTSEIYSSESLVPLTPNQQQLVTKISANIYRPCCGNSVSFPDCNHGMAALGYVELAVSQGVSEKKIYQDVLGLNSFWFPKQYVTLAAYFDQQKIDWKHADAKLALGENYSSGQGMARIAQEVQNVPGISNAGGGCSA